MQDGNYKTKTKREKNGECIYWRYKRLALNKIIITIIKSRIQNKIIRLV